MSRSIGFVILSHNHPLQLHRLVRRLQRSYDNPPIAIHHDFGQSSLRQSDFPSDVRFVLPHIKTRWGKFSLVAAALKALDLLYHTSAPNWFVLLSAADYPTMSADKVVGDLASSGVDALLDYREVPKLADPKHQFTYTLSISNYSASLVSSTFNSRRTIPENPSLAHFELDRNLELAWRRYMALNVWCPIVRIRNGPRIGRYTVYLPFNDWKAPFSSDFKCFYGDQWFTGNDRVAAVLLNPNDKHIRLQRHLRARNDVSDECYYQTVLANESGLKISRATRRFCDWTNSAGGPTGGAHPKVLAPDDLLAIRLSKAHFARKFAPESLMLDELDQWVS